MYSAAQIVALACQIAKCPGYASQAGQLLNAILADLCQTRDLDIIRTTVTLNITGSSASYALPADHLRTREVFYLVNGTVFYLNQIPLEDYDVLFKGPGVTNYPQSFAVDVSTDPNTIYFWPPPAMALPVTFRYQPQKDDITLPESSSTIPWFPNQRYLIKKLAADLMLLVDDSRQAAFDKDADDILKNYLIMDDDKGGYAQQVKLDARSFKSRRALSSTKQNPL